MNPLERRCRFLLRAYPQPYRTSRGDEIVATMVQVAPPGRDWPGARETRSLIAGGIKVRATANRQLPLAGSLRLAGLLAAALGLGLPVSLSLYAALNPGRLMMAAPTAALWAVSAAGPGLAIFSAWFWPRRVTITLALATAATSTVALVLTNSLHRLGFDLRQIVPSLVLAAFAAGKHRPPRSWLLLPALWLTACAITALVAGTTGGIPLIPIYLGFFAVASIAVLWALTDARPAIAVGLTILANYLTNILMLRGAPSLPSLGQTLILAAITAALAVAIVRARRTSESLS